MTELSDLAPPRKGAREGYYPDPMGGRRARWWDGRAWTLTVGPMVEAGAPRGKAIPPPTKVCPSCAAQSKTFAAICPNCGRSYTRTSPWKIAAICAAAFLLTVGGCGGCVLISAKLADEERNSHAITPAEYRSLRLGTPRSTVEDRLGDPGFHDRGRGRRCIYYYEKDTSLLNGDTYELCFENDRLVTKDSY
jgi:Protein of unknown function (DUF2510)